LQPAAELYSACLSDYQHCVPLIAALLLCEIIAEITGLTDESVCPTLVRKALRFCGAGGPRGYPACQLIFHGISGGGCAITYDALFNPLTHCESLVRIISVLCLHIWIPKLCKRRW
jgi:hypothetical protein